MQPIKKLTALRHVLGQEKYRRNDELIFTCKNPYGCNGNHHKPKLSVNIETDVFHCWVCGWKGSNLKSILKLGSRQLYEEYSQSIKKAWHEEEVPSVRNYDAPILPTNFISLSAKKTSLVDPYRRAAINYLRDRGIGEKDILKFKLGYCLDGEYSNRIICPSFDENGDLNFFVGRKFTDTPGTNYKHGEFDKDIIFNEYLIDWNEPIIIVEGPFDAMIAGDNAIPLQGSILREESKLFKKIVVSRVPVYLALDVDARAKQLKYAELFSSYGVDVFHIALEREGVNDVGDLCSHEKFDLAKRSAIPVGNKISLLRLRASA